MDREVAKATGLQIVYQTGFRLDENFRMPPEEIAADHEAMKEGKPYFRDIEGGEMILMVPPNSGTKFTPSNNLDYAVFAACLAGINEFSFDFNGEYPLCEAYAEKTDRNVSVSGEHAAEALCKAILELGRADDES